MKSIAFRILAALCFFTRLPLWKIADVPREYYERVTPLWPLAGWITGGVMAIVYYAASFCFPAIVALLLAIIARTLLTGALHEDGFADFCDGFGGGTSRQRTLEIMKDSHIGTYGVLGLILYYALMVAVLCSVGKFYAPGVRDFALAANLLCGDAYCKWASSTIVYFLPYARNAEQAKNKLVYAKVPVAEKIMSCLLGCIPFMALGGFAFFCIPSCFATIIVCAILFATMKKKIQGYTGDCCGASFIISELMFHFTLLASLKMVSF